MRASKLIPFQKALLWIFLSTLLISGSVGAGLIIWRHYQQSRTYDDRYTIVALVQSCSSLEPLSTDYLAELLGLSLDQPTNLYRFNIHEAVQKLKACPIIKSPEVKKIVPGMLFVKYGLRKPIACSPECTNGAIDEEGYLIPLAPFFSKNEIPEIVLGLPQDLFWGMQLNQERLDLAKKIIHKVHDWKGRGRVKRVDVSASSSRNYGEREIVLLVEEPVDSISNSSLPITLRFSPDNWLEQIQNYQQLREDFIDNIAYKENKGIVIDLRLSQLAFITNSL